MVIADQWAERSRGFLILVDLDDFKNVNDSLGHEMGDQVLVTIAKRFAAVANTGQNHVARLGGDEFALLVEGDTDDAVHAANRLIEKATEPLTIETMVVSTGASAGVAAFVPGIGSDEVRRRAGIALREAKKTGVSRTVYDEALEAQSVRRNELAARLPVALANGELVVYHQAKLEFASNQITGTEALVRWHHPDFGIVSPGEFLDLVSVGGHHRALFDLVLEQALVDVALLAKKNNNPNQTVAVNVNTRNLRETDLSKRVAAAIAAAGLSPHNLTLELTEDAFISEDAFVLGTLSQLAEKGIQLSVDDFGTGYSALAYLARLPVSEVKIDRSLASQVTQSPRLRAVVESVLSLAEQLSLDVVAEGIEDLDTLECLAQMGCRFGQGYFIGRPAPVDEVVTSPELMSMKPHQADAAGVSPN